MSGGITARLRAPLDRRADFADVLADGWQMAAATDLAARPVYLDAGGTVTLGDLFAVDGEPDGSIRFVGDLGRVDRIGAGLRGGEVIVEGNAGHEIGARMRRGLIAVTGDAGMRAGLSVIAGTVLVGGSAGREPGLWSKRGSIVILGSAALPPTYRYACTYQPEHVRLMLERLRRRFGLAFDARVRDGLYDRYSGDLAELGKGELLIWHHPT